MPTALICFWGLDAAGLWEPVELDVAARFAGRGGAHDAGAPLSWLQRAAGGLLAWWGPSILALRLPSACFVAATALLVFFAGRRLWSARAAWLGWAVVLSTPGSLADERLAGGGSAATFWSGALGLCLLAPIGRGLWLQEARAERGRIALWVVVTSVCAGFSLWEVGVLRAWLPPLAAVVLTLWVRRLGAEAWRWSGAAVLGLIVIGVIVAVVADSASHSLWLGGAAQGLLPPTGAAVLRHMLHRYAPWSALLFVALYLSATGWRWSSRRALTPAEGQGDAFALIFALWLAFALAAQVVYRSRYGTQDAVVLVPLAVSVGAVLDRHRPAWGKGVWWLALGLPVVLLLRDALLFPAAWWPLAAQNTAQTTALPRWRWGWLLSYAWWGMAAALWLARACPPPAPWLTAWRRLWRQVWPRGWPSRLWTLVLLLPVVCLLLVTPLAWALPAPTSRWQRAWQWARFAALLPLALLLLPDLWARWRQIGVRLGRGSVWPMVVAALGMAVLLRLSLWPLVSQSQSRRDVYQRLQAHVASTEGMATFMVDARAAPFELGRALSVLPTAAAVQRYLYTPERRWLLLPRARAAEIEQKWRLEQRTHLFVASEPDDAVWVVANHPPTGRRNHNPFVHVLRSKPPPGITPLEARWAQGVRLLGWRILESDRAQLRVGQDFRLRLVWQADAPLHGRWRIFVHIDGAGRRLNGDHDPAGGLWPLRYWRGDDVVVDDVPLTVPVDWRRGRYTIFVGLFDGPTRLKVVVGDADGDDRLRAGT
ncbi:MAG: hypothetical protein ACPGUV_00165, partial [Polyangiales bacterium]